MIGNKKDGINLIIKSINIEPKNSGANYDLACLYSLNNESELALKYLDKSIKLNPKLKSNAKKDIDFYNLRNIEKFKKIIK